MKALCSERYEDWTAKFGPLGMKCKELTGDTELDDYFELQDVHIVLTTPVSDPQSTPSESTHTHTKVTAHQKWVSCTPKLGIMHSKRQVNGW